MSKHASAGGGGGAGRAGNTLLNYFSKTPPAGKKSRASETPAAPASSNMEHDNSKKRERPLTESPKAPPIDSDEDSPIGHKKKRIRLYPVDSDDSDTENKVDNGHPPKEKISLEKKLNDSFKYEPKPSPQSKPKKAITSSNSTPTSKPELTKPPETQGKSAIADEGNWTHCKLDWLKPDKIRDAKKRRPDHPEYDPRTLFVPDDFRKQQTPAHRQWWDMKATHFDCVLFFKVGKFYELYHMDAAVGVNELGFSYMKGDFAHSGFPESAYARMASTLVSKGYKVARVEQTETPDMMQERCKKTGLNSKFDKVVAREICQVACKGAEVCGLQDNIPDHPANYMMCVAEEEVNGQTVYGVCFVETSMGQFHLGQFEDDKHSSRLLTTFAHYPPALIIYERKTTTPRTSKLIQSHCHNARKEPVTQSWPPDKTLKILAEKYYKTDAEGEWPEGLRPFLHDGDALGLTPAANCFLAIKALGGCIAYLTEALLDIQVVGMSQYTLYAPPDLLNQTLSQEERQEKRWEGSNTMVLDAITLKNLRIVGEEGALVDKLNYCVTAMGKRLLRQYVCSPSCSVHKIRECQQAVTALYSDQALCQDAKAVLLTMPDLDRLLAKLHTLGNLLRSQHHPDARAIFYEEKKYSKRKVQDFLSVLNGFESALKLVELFEETDSALLKRITQFAPDGCFPDYRKTLKFFKEAFNHTEAEKEGRIVPGMGVDREYDLTLQNISEIEEELESYRKEQEKYFRARVTYVGSDKKRYQLEVAQTAASRAGPEYHLEGARKGYKRFSTDETKDLLARMITAEVQKSTVLKDLSRRIFEKFSSNQQMWKTAVECLSTLDVMMSLAEFARQQSDVCMPKVTVCQDDKPYIRIVEGRHPCIPIIDNFIPNDTMLGGSDASLLLLTGPNMGGKSTLMRQVGLLTVLAHLGSYIPAQECCVSLVDRIFTRLGASDDILSGQSTFLVEMNETAAIVRHATVHSLVLLDELGRGTSTYDGTAIASAVAMELASRECRVLFSTHYHALVNHLSSHDNVLLGHMACMVETDESTADSDEIPEETITFLYKLTPGACPKSYGFNAARLAGIPKSITQRAQRIARDIEREATCVRAFRDVVKGANGLREMLAGLKI